MTRSRTAEGILRELEAGYGGREQVLSDLAAVESPEAQALVRLMSDPLRRGDSLLALAADANLAPTTILNLLKDAAMQRAIVHSQFKIADRLPTVVDRVADAAEGGLFHCPCTQDGTVDPLPVCTECRGTGKTYRRPSLPHQQLMLEASDLLKRGQGGQININTHNQVGIGIGAGCMPGFFDQMVKGFGQVLKNAPAARTQRTTSLALRDDFPTDVSNKPPVLDVEVMPTERSEVVP